jgi:hypothetical protein
MKRILLLCFSFYFAFANLVQCQNIIPKRSPDQVYIRETPVWKRYPSGEGPIVFNTKACGTLQKTGADSFLFIGDPVKQLNYFYLPFLVRHTSPLLFSDCIYIDPIVTFRDDPLGERWTRDRTIFANVDSGSVLINPENSVPASFRMYVDTSGMKTDFADRLVADTIFPKQLTPYLESFYFRKYEVSNKEYKEFISWVRDSIARIHLGYVTNGKIDWTKPINWADTTIRNKTGLYFKQENRFWHRHEIATQLLTYHFTNAPSEYGRDTINIYPDTLSWVHDWMYSFNEPMTNMYCWHPAYDDYPVVGVNYWQCLAFLEWKTKQLQQQFNKEGKKYRVVCALPSDAQWDMVTTAIRNKENLYVFPNHYETMSDNSWLTDLQLNQFSSDGFTIYAPEQKDTTSHVLSAGNTKRNSMKYFPFTASPREMLREEDHINDNIKTDGYFHTGPVNPNMKIKAPRHLKTIAKELQKNNARYIAHTDQTGACYLDGNASEWLCNDLDSCWRPVFTKHLVLPQGPLNESAVLTRQMENYFYKQLPIHGKLVRGSNWYDERYSNKYGKNTAGMNAKTFVDPNKAHCTVGFRYVIYVYPY